MPDEHAAPLSAEEIEAVLADVLDIVRYYDHVGELGVLQERKFMAALSRVLATLDAYRAVMADMVALELCAGEYHRDYYSEDEVDALKDHARALLSQE
jgi:hypothetical protein